MKSSERTRSRTTRAADRISWRSDSIWRGASGRCTLTTTSSPVGSVARCTWPIDAAAIGGSSKREERLLDREPQLLLDHPPHVGERDRRHVVLQLAQLGDDVRRHHVGAGREELAELDERRPELVEHLAQAPAAVGELRVVVAAPPVDQVAEAVAGRDPPDLGQPADPPLGPALVSIDHIRGVPRGRVG